MSILLLTIISIPYVLFMGIFGYALRHTFGPVRGQRQRQRQR